MPHLAVIRTLQQIGIVRADGDTRQGAVVDVDRELSVFHADICVRNDIVLRGARAKTAGGNGVERSNGMGGIADLYAVDLPKDIFMVDGKLAEDILFEGSQVPMSDAQGNRMMGIVKEVGESTVKMDFNHPMAGKTLNFDVEVVSVRDVTPEDLQGGCSCGECGGDCGG